MNALREAGGFRLGQRVLLVHRTGWVVAVGSLGTIECFLEAYSRYDVRAVVRFDGWPPSDRGFSIYPRDLKPAPEGL